MADVLFDLKGVYYSYLGKIPALCGVDLSIEKGSKVSVIGANGTGKSTILMILDALVFRVRGEVTAFDRRLTEEAFNDADFSRFFRSKVGFVFQNPDVQLFCPTVQEDIVFGPLQLGIPDDEVKKRLVRLTENFKIEHLLERSPHQLSIGEKKKVAIASVLAIQPDVLLLDEPTAGLDPQTTRDIIDIILEENASGKTVVTATHDLHVVDEIADIVHVLGSEKNVIRRGPPAEILSDEEFLKKNNLIHIHRHRHQGLLHTHPHLHSEHHLQNVVK